MDFFGRAVAMAIVIVVGRDSSLWALRKILQRGMFAQVVVDTGDGRRLGRGTPGQVEGRRRRLLKSQDCKANWYACTLSHVAGRERSICYLSLPAAVETSRPLFRLTIFWPGMKILAVVLSASGPSWPNQPYCRRTFVVFFLPFTDSIIVTVMPDSLESVMETFLPLFSTSTV